MLKNGIYEQIVNTRINKELQQLDREKYDIELEKLDGEDARRILTIYISYVINQALQYLRDSFPSSKENESLLAQIRLCNEIVQEIAEHTNEPEFEDNIILEKGEVLTSLYEKMNSARSINTIKVVHPETSIVENALFTGSKNEPSMLSELKKEILSSDSIDLLVSFIKWSAIRPLLVELTAFTKREGVRLRVIATTYTQATDYKAIVALAELPNTEVKINYETNHARMHAKSYLFKRDTGFSTAYIGSSNLSNPALTGGLEWNVKVTEKESFDIVKKFSVSFESYWNDASFETFDPENPDCHEKLKKELTRAHLIESQNVVFKFRFDHMHISRKFWIILLQNEKYTDIIVIWFLQRQVLEKQLLRHLIIKLLRRRTQEHACYLWLTERRFSNRAFRNSRKF